MSIRADILEYKLSCVRAETSFVCLCRISAAALGVL